MCINHFSYPCLLFDELDTGATLDEALYRGARFSAYHEHDKYYLQYFNFFLDKSFMRLQTVDKLL